MKRRLDIERLQPALACPSPARATGGKRPLVLHPGPAAPPTRPPRLCVRRCFSLAAILLGLGLAAAGCRGAAQQARDLKDASPSDGRTAMSEDEMSPAAPTDRGAKEAVASSDATAGGPGATDRTQARQTLMVSITIFVLSIFVGVELITKVPATLHTPLMSGSNAISGITVVGALIAAGGAGWAAPAVGLVAVILATINVVGGFLVTHRMLRMFDRR